MRSELFGAENWTKIYQSFKNVNFNSLDFDSMKNALIQYIRINYPEDFNDWIESSEVVIVVDILCYLMSVLCYRQDLNSRDNFLDVAERKSSVLRLARSLGYNSRRVLPARGLLKITRLRTTQSVFSSDGTNLANQTIAYNSAVDPDWYEKFVTVLNAALSTSNFVGQPLASSTISGIASYLYPVEKYQSLGVYGFTANTLLGNLDFEIVSSEFDQDFIRESQPDPNGKFNIVYRQDGFGHGSADTGFFCLFKQGQLSNTDFYLDRSYENLVLDVNKPNINEFDVWVSLVNADGSIAQKWTAVPSLYGQNTFYNTLTNKQIYEIITRENDQISIRFGDGRFTDIPVGNLRVQYRQSLADAVVLEPQDLNDISIQIPYRSSTGSVETLTVQLSLQTRVANSLPSATSLEIRNAAPVNFYTGDRLVNGEDYSVVALASGRAALSAAVNRIYSGQSLYWDMLDPTGTASRVQHLSQTGVIYQDNQTATRVVSRSTVGNNLEFVVKTLEPVLSTKTCENFYFDQLVYQDISRFQTQDLVWYAGSASQFVTGGRFNRAVGPQYAVDAAQYIRRHSLIKSQNSWFRVLDIQGGGNTIDALTGATSVTLDGALNSWQHIDLALPTLRQAFLQQEIALMVQQLDNQMSFGLGYDLTQDSFYVITDLNLNLGDFSLDYAQNTSLNNLDSSWLIACVVTTDSIIVYTRELRRYFESQDVKFINPNVKSVIDNTSGQSVQDNITILDVNTKVADARSWVPGVEYALNDVVKKDQTYYQCVRPGSQMQFAVNQWALINYDLVDVVNYVVPGTLPVVVPGTTLHSVVIGTAPYVVAGTNLTVDLDPIVITPPPYTVDIGTATTTLTVNLPSITVNPDPQTISINPQNGTAVTNPIDVTIEGLPFGTTVQHLTTPAGQPWQIPVELDSIINEEMVENRVMVVENWRHIDPLLGQEIVLNILGNRQDSKTLPIANIVEITGQDRDMDGSVDVPDYYYVINTTSEYLFWSVDTDQNTTYVELPTADDIYQPASWVQGDVPSFEYISDSETLLVLQTHPGLYVKIQQGLYGLQTQPTVAFVKNNRTFYQLQTNQYTSASGYMYRRGRKNLIFMYNHYSDASSRIDPCVTNVIDIRVLTYQYDTEVRQWIKSRNTTEPPEPPTAQQLKIDFGDLENNKMISDQVVWHPVKYKYLFGRGSQPELRARFKAIKSKNSNLTDNQLKSKMVELVDLYFQLGNWNFGETFYFTELSAFLHQKLAGDLASVVIVPENSQNGFGDLFEVHSTSSEIFISTLDVNSIDVVKNYTVDNLKIG